MALTKVLITVKTYPSLSAKYGELVCTAGFLEDGSWIRLYPIPFRNVNHLESRLYPFNTHSYRKEILVCIFPEKNTLKWKKNEED